MTLAAMVLAGCKREAPAPPPPPRPAMAPIRGAAGNSDMRMMLADIASAKACAMVRGRFRALRDAKRPDVAIGVLWIRDCKITNDGTHVTFRLHGNGWQWAEQAKHKAGGNFTISQYVKFGVDITMLGSVDMAYDPHDHVVSMWFTPSAAPKIDFEPVGNFDVDRHGAWSSVVGAVGSVFGSSPEDLAATDAKSKGTQQFRDTLAEGLAVTIDLCTGLVRLNLGRRPRGVMQHPDVGETTRVPVELHPGGLAMVGPQLAPRGMTIRAETTQGAARITLLCASDAERLAGAFLAGKPPLAPAILGQVDVRGKARLHIKRTHCPVIAIATPLDNRPATFAWRRPSSEIARSLGGPVLQCSRK